MGRIIKSNLILFTLIIFIVDMVIGYFLFKSREFSHLAIWNILESKKKDDFYWHPENAPGYFRFEPPSGKISVFRDEIFPLTKNQDGEFKIALKAASHLMDICSRPNQQGRALKWDSPEGMLSQVKKGAAANCFHRAILFSTYLSSLGIKSRLWALENDNFDAIAHSVNEVYIKSLKKWVFVDVMFGFYVTEGGYPLSFLELRERLLNNKSGNILVKSIGDGNEKQYAIPLLYSKLVKCVFLRAKNDFVNRYDKRYGIFSIFRKHIDRSNDGFRRGMEYLLGAHDVFIHYVDRDSPSLKGRIFAVKLLFYFFIFSLAAIGASLAINLSKRDTRHR